MLFNDENYSIIDKKMYEDLIDGSDKKEFYLYHYIFVVYQDNIDIKTIKIDQVKDLYKLKDLHIIYKYYIIKAHYYNEFNNIMYDEGMPTFVYNIGYFLVGGDAKTKKSDKKEFEKLLENYNSNYSNMDFPYDDTKFLSLNKSIINF